MNPGLNSVSPAPTLNRFFSGSMRATDERMLRSMQTLDVQLETQAKAREQERKAFQQDVFLRSRELEELLARRQNSQNA